MDVRVGLRFWTVVLEKTLESPLACKEIQPGHPKRDQSWIFIHWKDWCWNWNSNTLATWCEELTHYKRPWSWKDWRQEEKGTTEDQMVGWHHWLDGHEFEQAPGVGDGQRSLACCSPWVTKSQTQQSDGTELNSCTGRWIPIHFTTREVPIYILIMILLSFIWQNNFYE